LFSVQYIKRRRNDFNVYAGRLQVEDPQLQAIFDGGVSDSFVLPVLQCPYQFWRTNSTVTSTAVVARIAEETIARSSAEKETEAAVRDRGDRLVEGLMVGDRAGPRPHRAHALRAGAINLKNEPGGCILWLPPRIFYGTARATLALDVTKVIRTPLGIFH
jgi:hypothetical protein